MAPTKTKTEQRTKATISGHQGPWVPFGQANVYDKVWSERHPADAWRVLYWLTNRMTGNVKFEDDPIIYGIVAGGNPVSFKDIASDLQCCWRSVQRASQWLADKGMITRARSGRGQEYRFHVVNSLRQFELQTVPGSSVVGTDPQEDDPEFGTSFLDESGEPDELEDEDELASPHYTPVAGTLMFACNYCGIHQRIETIGGHLNNCRKKPKEPSPEPTPTPVPPTPVTPPAPQPVPPPVIKVKCSMPHCTGEGPEESVKAHMALRNNVCKECKTAYHTKFELSACEDMHIEDYNAEGKAKEEAEWVSMEPWQRRAKWEKDKATGTRAGWKKFGRWTEGGKFND